MLPRARIPIIKLTMPPTSSVPFGMSCDIGFENRLALENTRLLLTYAMIDTRLRTLVLFRKSPRPYLGRGGSTDFADSFARISQGLDQETQDQQPVSRNIELLWLRPACDSLPGPSQESSGPSVRPFCTRQQTARSFSLIHLLSQ